MAISDEEYAEWLGSDDAERVLLVEAVSHDGADFVTRYFSNSSFVSEPTDVPANTIYADRLLSSPQFRSAIDGAVGVGAIVLNNVDGLLDPWLSHSWAGHPLRLYFGDRSWARADFRQVLEGVSDGLSAPVRDRLSLVVRDQRALLEVPALLLREDGQYTPRTFGNVFNVTPILIDANTHRYKVNDGAVTSITVRDQGVVVTANIDLAIGEFALTAQPAGQITCDVVQVDDTANLMVRALAAIAGYALLDDEALNDFPNTATIGLYVNSQEEVSNLLTKVARSVGAAWLPDRLGYLSLVRLQEPSGTPVLELDEDDLEDGALRIARVEQPRAHVQLGYKKNWTVQGDSDLAGSVTAANRLLYGLEQQAVKITNDLADSLGRNRFPLAEQPELLETLFRAVGAATTEAERRATLRNRVRFVYQGAMFAKPLSLKVGDVVRLTHPRFELDTGELLLVVALSEQPTDRTVTVDLWA